MLIARPVCHTLIERALKGRRSGVIDLTHATGLHQLL